MPASAIAVTPASAARPGTGANDEVEEELEILESEGGDESGYSRQARALSSLDDDLIPVIPESSMLELVDDTDIGKLMSFMELGGDPESTLSVLDIDDDDDGLASQGVAASSSPQVGPDLDYEPEFFLGQLPRPPGSEQEDEGSDISLSLSLSAIDLTALEEFGTALDALGSLMVAEVGKALPPTEGEVPELPLIVPLLVPMDLSDSRPDSGSGHLAEEELRPLSQLSPLSASWAGAAEYRGADLRSMPVSGMLEAVDDEEEAPQLGLLPVSALLEGGAEDEALVTIDSFASGAADSSESKAELPGPPAGEGPITLREGIYFLQPQAGSERDLDPGLRLLVESVLMPTSEGGVKASGRKKRKKR